ncbi:hypothetical protein CHARACLAT_017509 [Characodon lateralis]|uniref:Uncharacterized protein n=1 Tax=Characodon lateralis TaxID=208331 RepID=A0ABU7CZ45_9TELE|nr:hypothetical protein [Characodon lateralis]
MGEDGEGGSTDTGGMHRAEQNRTEIQLDAESEADCRSNKNAEYFLPDDIPTSGRFGQFTKNNNKATFHGATGDLKVSAECSV